jgi:outer membrane protein insertion porin family
MRTKRPPSLARVRSARAVDRVPSIGVLCVLCVLGVLLTDQRAEGAVDDYLGKSIASVRLLIEGRDTIDPALARVVETPVGQPLTIAAVRDTISHLFSLGRFDDIRVDAALDGNRVALRYELSPIHPVTSIQFTGTLKAPGIDTGAMRKAVVDRFGTSPSLGQVDELRQIVGDVLRERGYLHPEIRPRADIAHAPDRATLVFVIEPGPRTVVGEIDIVGTPAEPRAELLNRLHLAPGVAYQRDALDDRIARYVADRRKAGYYEAKITVTPTLLTGDRTANLLLTVMPGAHVRVVFRGDPLPENKRVELVPVEREGAVDEDLLEDSTNRIEDYLRSQGYRDALAPHAREEGNGELLVRFDVKRGLEYRVDRLEISGNASVPLTDLAPALKLRDGQPFAESKLDADLSALEDLYHRRGFVDAVVRSAEEPQPADAAAGFVPLRVRLVINEGPRTMVSGVAIQGNRSVPETALKEDLGLQPGRPYVDTQLVLDRDAIQLRYVNLGYPNVAVEANPNFSADRTSAAPVFTVREGPRVFVDHVLIVGNVRTSTETIERELQLKPGDPLSEAAKIESRRRLATLGLFRRIQIAELGHGEETKQDVVVTIEESPATTMVFGLGGEGRLRVVRTVAEGTSDRLDVAPRGSFGISRRNLFGKNRSVSLFTSVSVRLQKQQVFTAQDSLTTNDQFAPPEYRVIGTYVEPRIFNTTADALITGTFEQQARSSFNFARRGASVQIKRQVTREVQFFTSYQLQRTRLFDASINPVEQPLIDRLFPQVRLSSVSSSAVRDTRDDAVDPGAGGYFSANVQLAGRHIGSEVGFAKTFLRAQLFKTAPQRKRLVLAGNASLGMATGFAREVTRTDANGEVTTALVADLPASERFFAGGDTTVRGFSLDALGTPATLDKDGFPIGGNATVILNAELRATVWPSVQAVGFFDAGNVFSLTTNLDLREIRGAVGVGVRYRSPVGPIRVDLGFKVHREEIAGRREGLTALHISLGQAF